MARPPARHRGAAATSGRVRGDRGDRPEADRATRVVQDGDAFEQGGHQCGTGERSLLHPAEHVRHPEIGGLGGPGMGIGGHGCRLRTLHGRPRPAPVAYAARRTRATAGHAAYRGCMRTPVAPVLVALVLTAGLASTTTAATAATAAASPGPATCGNGTPAPAGPGRRGLLVADGDRELRHQPRQVTVTGDVTVEAGATLVSTWALGPGGVGTSGLTVGGNLVAGAGTSLLLGCDPSELYCYDDPHTGSPTLSSTTTVHGSIEAVDPLGVVMHHSSWTGTWSRPAGAAGSRAANPTENVFTHVPDNGGSVYSDYENVTIGGNLRVTGVRSCWFGTLRTSVGGSATFADNTYHLTDADEILNNAVSGNLLCAGLQPAVHFGTPAPAPERRRGLCHRFVRLRHPPGLSGVHTAGVPAPLGSGAGRRVLAGGRRRRDLRLRSPVLRLDRGRPGSVAGFAATPGGIGYQSTSATGSITSFGPHPACGGSVGGLSAPVVGLVAAPGGDGCWSVASDGGIFAFGSGAPFYGSAGAIHLNEPIVGMAPAPDGDGYYLVASDGGIFAFGPGAHFQGSMGGQHLNQPIVGMAVDPSTGGYWLVASDGGIFSSILLSTGRRGPST